MNDVVIISPNKYSLYSICVLELLTRKKITVKAIVVRTLFNPDRFISEFRRDGSRLLKKIWKKFVLRKKAYKNTDGDTILRLMRTENIRFKSIDECSAVYGIPVITCKNLNDAVVFEALEKARPDLVVFTGGGIVREHILKKAGAGILNCHIGVLPRYRGMDVVEWPIIENRMDSIGMTVHFMDTGLDTGDILKVMRAPLQSGDTIKKIRDKCEPIMCRLLSQTCCEYLNGQLKRIPQKKDEGRQYFIMHPGLMSIADSMLRKRDVVAKSCASE